MKLISILLLFLIPPNVFLCCNFAKRDKQTKLTENKTYVNIYVIDSLKKIINSDIRSLKSLSFPQNVFLKDTILESEGVSWKGFSFYKESKLLFLVETNWQDTNKIQRIGISSSEILGPNGIKVGSKFKDIKNYLSNKIPSCPDGYFCLDDKIQKDISYFFDIQNNEKLYYGNIRFDSIPEDVEVNEILIE